MSESAKKASPTPRPWPKIEPVFIAQAIGEALNFGEYRFPYVFSDGSCLPCPREEALANAELMNRAVKAHQALVDALREMLTALEMEGACGLRFFEARNGGLAALALAEGK